MPEGDTAYRVARQLESALANTPLTEFQIRTSTLIGANFVGQQVDGVQPFGKHIFIRMGEWSLHSHMLMDGIWHIYQPGAKWRRPAHQARVILGTEHTQAVGFLVAQLQLVRREDEVKLVGHLGPDPLKPEWDAGGLEIAASNIQTDPRAIHVALLDQSNVAGFGNEYANEICFLMGVDPAAPATSVDALAILKLGTRLIRANKDRVERTTTGNTRPGQRLYVFGRSTKPCRRCGTTIQFTLLGANPEQQRNVFWCPNCQPSTAKSPR